MKEETLSCVPDRCRVYMKYIDGRQVNVLVQHMDDGPDLIIDWCEGMPGCTSRSPNHDRNVVRLSKGRERDTTKMGR